MIFISHRGNITGPDERENKPSFIESALNLGYHVEIDVWCIEGNIALGHDRPMYDVSKGFLFDDRLLCHAKNKNALYFMSEDDRIHHFWHENDHYALTSKGIYITHPKSEILRNSIVMLPEQNKILTEHDIWGSYGVCSDYVNKYRSEFA